MIIREKKRLQLLIQKFQSQGESVLFKTGCYDILHPGHIDSINKLSKKANVLIIGVHSDERVRDKKGEKRPINSQEQRIQMVDGLKKVNYTFPMQISSRSEYVEFLHFIRPDFVSVTETNEQKKKDYSSKYWQLVELPDKNLPGFSTTEIIDKIRKIYC